MAYQEHLDILMQGIEVWNHWRREHQDIHPNLSGANLSGTNLMNFDLSETDLSRANLSGANLSGAQLWVADLSDADLQGAKLVGALFSAADLSRANLSSADLTIASFRMSMLKEVDLRKAKLVESILAHADLSGADLTGADLSQAMLVGTDLRKAKLTNCRIYGTSVWDVQLDEAEQLSLIITPLITSQPTITVDNLEVAQFIYLLLEHKKLRDVLDSVMEKAVLLLGRFGGGGLELLQAIAEKLREMKYLPIIFDFDRPEGRNLTETVMTLVGLSRFVIVDLSGPSVPNELRSTIPHFRIPFVPIIEGTRKVYSMFADFLEDEWVLAPVEFTSKEHLLQLLPSKVVEPAEKKSEERQIRLKQIFNR